MDLIETVKYSHWYDLVNDIEKLPKDQYIFRGQTNQYCKEKNETFEWKLNSSFNRYYPPNFYKFSTFLSQQLNNTLFQNVYRTYNFDNIEYQYIN